ncbi:hypothetical protein [Phyllobacterium sp. 22552]|uniref:hypothetical protein n=1 Tax=Phyllobacterium sp. 22552 TaxID=3453941 RepID=UPI003F850DE7
MTKHTNTPAIATATMAPVYLHETMSGKAFDTLSQGWNYTTLGNAYSYVEYLNSPCGLVVLAHQGDFNGQVDGIHPARLSHSIESTLNIIEPLKGHDKALFRNSPVGYNMHWMTRRSQGSLVLTAFDRMIDGGDPEAPYLKVGDDDDSSDGFFSVAVYDAPHGPVIGIHDYATNVAHVIRPAVAADEMREAA